MTLPAAGASTQNCCGCRPDSLDSWNDARRLVEFGLLHVPIGPHVQVYDPAILDSGPGQRSSSLRTPCDSPARQPRADPSRPHSFDPCQQSVDRELRAPRSLTAPPQCVACMAPFSTTVPPRAGTKPRRHHGVGRVWAADHRHWTRYAELEQGQQRHSGPIDRTGRRRVRRRHHGAAASSRALPGRHGWLRSGLTIRRMD